MEEPQEIPPGSTIYFGLTKAFLFTELLQSGRSLVTRLPQ
ncbi:MAG: hypothetical protein A4E45_00269 [Methanosaeta sp. PtaB.Bin039]|nr:MAG: hypothetical protein A4E45_00269 [Methanosaeta sp. PtaB.Bin039]